MLHGASRDSEMAIRQIQAERRVAYLSLAFPAANSYAIIEFPAVGRDRRYEKYKDHSVFPHESHPTSTERKTQPFAYSAFKIASLERRRPRDRDLGGPGLTVTRACRATQRGLIKVPME